MFRVGGEGGGGEENKKKMKNVPVPSCIIYFISIEMCFLVLS
jgi:hypothetical protein